MLIAILILLMVSSVVAAGIPVAAKAYQKVVDASNAEALLSTTMTILRSDLSAADCDSISTSDSSGASISYTNVNTGVSYTISAALSDSVPQAITISSGGSSTATSLVAAQEAMNDIYTSFTAVSYSSGLITIDGLAVYKDGDAITDPASFQIRVINYSSST